MSPLLVDNLIHVAATWAGGALLVALLHLLERVSSRQVAHNLGWRGVLVTGWLGVPVHELSHLAAALLFGHRVVAWKLFDPDPVSGTLGYVRHAYSRRSPWQLAGGFFIGLAPLAAGLLGLAALLCWMAPGASWLAVARDLELSAPGLASRVLEGARRSGGLIWEHRSLLLPVQVYLAVCLTSHMAPSRADLAGGLWGGLLVLGLSAGGGALAAHLGHRLGAGALVLGLLLVLLLLAAVFQALYVGLARLVSRPARGVLLRGE